MLSHSNDERHLCLDSFFNGAGCLVGGNVYAGCVRSELLHGLGYVSSSLLSTSHIQGHCLTLRTDGRTGSPKCSPLRPGVTPPTTLVPQAIESLAFAVA